MPQSPTPTPSFTWDKHSLYELCAQNPPRDAKLLRAIHANSSVRKPSANLALGEDFSGTAALSRAWTSLSPTFLAIATDIHSPTIARATRDTPPDLATRITFHRADVMKVNTPVDLIAVLNFSICELHTRRDLLAYFKHARARLTRKKGVLICDLYGGADSYQTGLLDQTINPPRDHPASKDRILYSWEQRTADPLTARVVNAMHFDVTPGSGYPAGPQRASGTHKKQTPAGDQRGTQRHQVFLDAFVYDWRLWTIPELREAMHESGFKHTSVYPRTAGATDPEGNLYTQPIEDPTELDEAFNIFVTAS